MFFYEWIIPLLAVLALAAAIFYIVVRNRSGAGIRSDGRTVYDKEHDEHRPPGKD